MAFVNVGAVRTLKDYKPRVETRDVDYKTLFRFEKANVEWIANHFLGESTETRGGALTSLQKMKIFLRYMSDPGFQSGVGEDVGVDQTTVSKIVHQVKAKILQKVNLWIRFPENLQDTEIAKEEWQGRFTMPTTIGAIDCTHIRICKPSQDGDEYINRKNFPSINVQATCDAKERFTSVCAEWPGSVHDSRIFKNSAIYQTMMNKPDTILVGDSGYGISPWLLTPYANPITDVQRNFNRVYAKERVIIERVFGQLKRRFPILAYKVRTALKSVPGIIACCCILHNVAKFLNDVEDFPELQELGEDMHGEEENLPHDLTNRRVREMGQQKRDRFADILFLAR